MMSEPPPSLATLDTHATYLDALLRMMSHNWHELSGDRSRWPLLLARLHAQASLLAQATQDLAGQLAAYAGQHPHGELPGDASLVPVIAMPAADLGALYEQAGGNPSAMEALLLREHRWRLADAGAPLDIAICNGGYASAEVVFSDIATGRIALIAFYGFTEGDAKAALAERGITPILIPYVPQQADTVFSALPGPGRYDRFGALIPTPAKDPR